MSTRLLLMLGIATALLSGCHSPRGALLPYTGGSYTYYSTEQNPKTFKLVDTRTEELIFLSEIPPGRQLTIQFMADEGDDPVRTPDLMMFELMDLGTKIGKLRNSLTVPNAACRRIDIEFRSAPEDAPTPPGQMYRPDKLVDRPAWWTPEGGPMPEERTGRIYDN